jgi:hypothetical protein
VSREEVGWTAWTPDGRGLAFTESTASAGGGGTGRRLVFQPVFSGPGTPYQPKPPSPAVPDAIGLRVLGWRPDGSPVVAASYPKSEVDIVATPLVDTYPADVARVRVLALVRRWRVRRRVAAANGPA